MAVLRSLIVACYTLPFLPLAAWFATGETVFLGIGLLLFVPLAILFPKAIRDWHLR